MYITVLCLQKAEWLPAQNADDCLLKPVVRESKQTDQSETDLASIVVDDEALIPAVEVFMGVDLDSELLQHRLVGPLAHGMHGGANIIQDAHDARRILGITVNFRFLICSTCIHNCGLICRSERTLHQFQSSGTKNLSGGT